MTRQCRERAASLGGLCLAYGGHEPGSARQTSAGRPGALPRRPDATVINEAIPLFYIGRNRHGLWVAQDAEARTGGIFLSKKSALRFAKETSEPGGCATMLVAGPLELDTGHQGRRLVPQDAFPGKTGRRAVWAAPIFGVVRKVAARLWQAVTSEHAHRVAIERELFKNRYVLSSKNDDDLPVVG